MPDPAAFQLKEFLSKTRTLKLADHYKIVGFDCGHDDLNEFIVKDAIAFQKLLHSVTYILEYENQTIAYFSLQKDKCKMSPNSLRVFKSSLRKLTKANRSVLYQFLNMTEFPALKISRLAVHKDFQGKGIGTYLLDTITFSLLNEHSEGCMFITVDSVKNPDTIDFYRKNNFLILDVPTVSKDSVLMYKNLIELVG